MSPRLCLIFATLFGLLAVGLGAFGAHGLSDNGYIERQHADTSAKNVAGVEFPASYKYLQDYHTGVRYHMWHTLALLGIGLWMQHRACRPLRIAAWAFTLGIILFSGSLYVIAIGGARMGGIPWGLVAPVGGTTLLIGWCAALVAACQTSSLD